jgi:hypothetical protein
LALALAGDFATVFGAEGATTFGQLFESKTTVARGSMGRLPRMRSSTETFGPACGTSTPSWASKRASTPALRASEPGGSRGSRRSDRLHRLRLPERFGQRGGLRDEIGRALGGDDQPGGFVDRLEFLLTVVHHARRASSTIGRKSIDGDFFTG